MNCHEIDEGLTLYVMGDLDDERTQRVREHLDTCRRCQASARELELTLDLLRNALAAGAVEETGPEPERVSGAPPSKKAGAAPVRVRRARPPKKDGVELGRVSRAQPSKTDRAKPDRASPAQASTEDEPVRAPAVPDAPKAGAASARQAKVLPWPWRRRLIQVAVSLMVIAGTAALLMPAMRGRALKSQYAKREAEEAMQRRVLVDEASALLSTAPPPPDSPAAPLDPAKHAELAMAGARDAEWKDVGNERWWFEQEEPRKARSNRRASRIYTYATPAGDDDANVVADSTTRSGIETGGLSGGDLMAGDEAHASTTTGRGNAVRGGAYHEEIGPLEADDEEESFGYQDGGEADGDLDDVNKIVLARAEAGAATTGWEQFKNKASGRKRGDEENTPHPLNAAVRGQALVEDFGDDANPIEEPPIHRAAGELAQAASETPLEVRDPDGSTRLSTTDSITKANDAAFASQVEDVTYDNEIMLTESSVEAGIDARGMEEGESEKEALPRQKDDLGERIESAESTFKAHGVNPFIDAREEAFSTFSIDVDTASYTLSRNYIRNGSLPPPEAVRTEEFVNFFDYGYEAPLREAFAVTAAHAPSPFGRGLDVLRVGVQGSVVGREHRKSAVLTFVIDTSGSMETPERLGLLRKALRMLVAQLDEADQVAIVQYDSQARLVLEHTPVRMKKKIIDTVDNLQTSGSTHLEDGMKLGYATAAKGFRIGAMNRVLLLSDGVANLGSGDADEILKFVESYRRVGIYCSIYGFGMGSYDDEMLEAFADRGDGAYYFIDSVDEAKRVFVDELAATLHVIAKDAKIQVEFNPRRVKRYRQLGYENRLLEKEQFRDDTVDAGEVGSGQSVTALYEIELHGDETQPIGAVYVRYHEPDNGEAKEISHMVKSEYRIPEIDAAGPRFKLAAAVAEFSEVLRGSPFAAGSSYEDIEQVLLPLSLELNTDGHVQDLLRMVRLSSSLPRADDREPGVILE